MTHYQFKLERRKDIVHRHHFVFVRTPAWRITQYPVRMAIRLRVYVCACGKMHAVETNEVVR